MIITPLLNPVIVLCFLVISLQSTAANRFWIATNVSWKNTSNWYTILLGRVADAWVQDSKSHLKISQTIVP